MARPKGPPRASDGPSMVLIAVLAVLIAFAIWWWQSGMVPFWDRFFDRTPPLPERVDAAPQRTIEPPTVAATAEPTPAPHPLPPEAEQPPLKPLPPLERSDPAIRDALTAELPAAPLQRFTNMQDYVRRFVVTVDNLPRQTVPSQLSVFQRVPDPLVVERNAAGTMTLSPRNAARYDGVVRFVAALDPQTVVSLYSRFYPLLEQEYRNLGHPQGRFHDRLIFAIDDLLAAPTPDQPVQLVQPRVLYEFAASDLRALSAGQQAMIRVGPEHAARLRTVLRRLRVQLLGQAVN